MKVAAQCDFYLQHYGLGKGLTYLKDLGYQNLVYTITGRYDQPFTTQWTDKELEEYYSPIKKAVEESEMNMLFAILATDIYLDDLAHTADARRKMCVQAVKAAAYAGCKILGVRPAILVQTVSDALEKSKEITCGIFDEMKKVADEVGVTLAFINGTVIQGYSYGNHCYGSNINELIELANRYDGKIIVDPVTAEHAKENVKDMVLGAGDRLIGMLITDMEKASRLPLIPTMGCINYPDISACLKDVCEEAALVTMHTPVFKKYADFLNNDSMVKSLSQLLWKITDVMHNRSKNPSREVE